MSWRLTSGVDRDIRRSLKTRQRAPQNRAAFHAEYLSIIIIPYGPEGGLAHSALHKLPQHVLQGYQCAIPFLPIGKSERNDWNVFIIEFALFLYSSLCNLLRYRKIMVDERRIGVNKMPHENCIGDTRKQDIGEARAAFLAGGGEMGALIQSYIWSETTFDLPSGNWLDVLNGGTLAVTKAQLHAYLVGYLYAFCDHRMEQPSPGRAWGIIGRFCVPHDAGEPIC